MLAHNKAAVIVNGAFVAGVVVVVAAAATMGTAASDAIRVETGLLKNGWKYRELCTQTFQNPLIKEYTLNYGRIPNMV